MVMSIIVVAIHTRPELNWQSPIINMVTCIIYSLAVPFFFIASGFLLFRKITIPITDDGKYRIQAYLFKIAKLYFCWTLLYLPLSIYGFIKDGISFPKFIIVFVRNVLLVGENYMSWPLWYLLALILAISVIYCLLKCRVMPRTILLIGFLMSLVGLGLDYCKSHDLLHVITDIYFRLFVNTRNGLFVGLLYVAIGMVSSRISHFSIINLIALIIVGVIGDIMNVPYSNVITISALFMLTIVLPPLCISPSIARACRIMSTIIYFSHMFFVAIFKLAFGIEYGMSLFLLALTSTILFSLLLYRFRGYYIFQLLYS